MSARENGEHKQEKKGEVAYGDLHKQILSGLAKQDMIKAYDQWALTYDEECKATEATHKAISARTLGDQLTLSSFSNNAQTKAKPTKVLDVGCGTGLPAEILKSHCSSRNMQTEITGIDFSLVMLSLAAEKRRDCFSALINADITEPLPFPDNFFDAFLVVGVFIENHCSPHVLSHIARCLRPSAIGVITVRQNTYNSNHAQYQEAFNNARLTVIHNVVDKYLKAVKGNYIVLQKQQ